MTKAREPVLESASERFNLLDEPIISARTAAGVLAMSLPEVLETLGRDEVLSFEALQPHQAHAWHAFTVQLAALLLHSHDEGDPQKPAEIWRAWMREATDGMGAPWCLVSELKLAAFLQPPVAEGSLDGWKGPRVTPDDLDILVTAKNHDVKMNRMVRAAPEHWLYALLNLQTMQGFLGAGNYGIARMNGGFSNRPGIGLADGISLGGRFCGDVRALLARRAPVVESFMFRGQGGHGLIWMLPWDGNAAIDLGQCDPFFIEICRRIRLSLSGDQIEAFYTPTTSERVSSTAGRTGDAWTPIVKDAALTVSASGFHYERVSHLLFGHESILPSAAMDAEVERRDPHLFAWALVRGQGKTEGLKERILPVDRAVIDRLKRPDSRKALSEQVEWRINAVKDVRLKVLKPALCALFQGGPETKLDLQDDRPNRWLDALDDDVDRVFFRHLFETFGDAAELALDRWRREVLALAREQLRSAMHGGPVPGQRRYRAEAAAEAIFDASAFKQFGIHPFKESSHAVAGS
ncbi:MAG: type I-E CRISPR-associated protein Cse1/CasA [Deltaproteobacteria bacterium]